MWARFTVLNETQLGLIAEETGQFNDADTLSGSLHLDERIVALHASGLARFNPCQTRLCCNRGCVRPQCQDFARRSALTSQAARRTKGNADLGADDDAC